MAYNFRHEAQQALDRAKRELASGDDSRLKYAALELRMAMEGLTYDRATTYEDLPPEVFKTWQPKDLMEYMVEVDPGADKDSTIYIRRSAEPDQPMESLGTEKVLNTRELKKYYHNLGSRLHLPTIAQLEEGDVPAPLRLRKRCEEVVSIIEQALASGHHNSRPYTPCEWSCDRCGRQLRRKLAVGQQSLEIKCFDCGAEYLLSRDETGLVFADDLRVEILCPQSDCQTQNYLWRDDLRVGASWKCSNCQTQYEFVLGCRTLEPTTGTHATTST